MRLLNVKSFLNHKQAPMLEEFVATPPNYAILSHTWGDNEFLFEDLKNETGYSSTAYEKIRRCCKIAAAQDLKYLWVDSLCIDKSSSAELSEAINSMFDWYQKSSICYVYLEDVKATNPPGSPLTIELLRNCRWLTRGWTLQELIAPDKVSFYARDWIPCGDRESLASVLHEITNIDIGILQRQPGRAGLEPLYSCSISKRMSWASARETKRPEDTAYCLLGIFRVSMPMVYGEGGPSAFYRLQQEIMKHSTDQTIFAWSPAKQDTAQTMSVLAESPAAFADGSRIFPIAHNNAFEMTNKGLRIVAKKFSAQELQIETPVPKMFSILLHCYYMDDPFSNLAINVVQLKTDADSDDVFSRLMEQPSRIPLKRLRGQKDMRNALLEKIGDGLPTISTSVEVKVNEDKGQGNVNGLEQLRDSAHQRFKDVYQYLKGGTNLYITHITGSLQTNSTSSTYCYLQPLSNYVGSRSGPKIRVSYSGVPVSDPLQDGTRTAIFKPGDILEISLTKAEDERDTESAVTISCSAARPSHLEVTSMSCGCDLNCPTERGGDKIICSSTAMTIKVQLQAERISGRVCNDVNLVVGTDPFAWLTLQPGAAWRRLQSTFHRN